MDTAELIGILIGLAALALLLVIVFIKSNVVLCQPNEVLVVAGRRRRTKEGGTSGYRVIRGGRGFKMPLVESVARLPLTSMGLDLQVGKAMCAGMIPVNVDARASVKLAGREEDGLDAAIERFLGKGEDAVIKAAKQAVSGVLRGVLATMSPEEANAERLELAQQVTERSRVLLRDLGIVLDYFQVQDISDEAGYLSAIGRQRNAIVQRDARVAEATADAEARSVAADQGRIARTAEISAEQVVIGEENALVIRRAHLKGEENRAEERASVAGAIARAEEEVLLEERRIELARKRSQADVVVPAEAARDAGLLSAESGSARIREEGRATADALELLRAQWVDEDSKDLFLIQLLPTLMEQVTRTIADNLRIDKLTIVDSGDGNALPGHVRNVAGSAVAMLEQLRNATGIDIAKLAHNAQQGDAGLPRELD